VVTADERARIVTWKRKAIAAGCDAHLNKPIKKLILLEAMRNATALPRAGMPLSANGANTNGANANGTAPATCEPRPFAS
jgi:hypothetical protein